MRSYANAAFHAAQFSLPSLPSRSTRPTLHNVGRQPSSRVIHALQKRTGYRERLAEDMGSRTPSDD